MKRSVIAIAASSVGVLSFAQTAASQTAVERNLPPAPVTTPAPVAPREVPAASDDATPLGATLAAIVLLDGAAPVRDPAALAAAKAAGVQVPAVAKLDRGPLARRLRSYLGQPLSRRLIAAIEADIARAARRSGRPFVSLATPEQEITSGVLQIRVTEFRLGHIDVRGAKGRRAEALGKRMRMEEGEPVDARELGEDLDWTNRTPFRHVDAQFAPSAQAGRTDVTLTATAAAPVRVYAGWSNTGSDSTGLNRYYIGTLFRLPLLVGAYASYQLTGSDDAWVRDGHVLVADPRYRAQGGRIYIPTASRQDLEVTLSDTLTNQVVNTDFTVRQRTTEATLGYRTALSVLGAPSGWGDLLVGIEAKRQHRTVLFGGQVALDDTADIWQALIGWSRGWIGNGHALNASLNLHVSPGGISADNRSARLAAMSNGHVTSDRYAYATLDLSGQMRLPARLALAEQLSVQYAGRPVPLSGQIGLGGDGLVRGYTPDDGSYDTGAILRNELHLPSLSPIGRHRDLLSPFVFVDVGYGRDRAVATSSTVASTGIGSDYSFGRHFSAGFSSAWALGNGQRTRTGDWRLQARATVTF